MAVYLADCLVAQLGQDGLPQDQLRETEVGSTQGEDCRYPLVLTYLCVVLLVQTKVP